MSPRRRGLLVALAVVLLAWGGLVVWQRLIDIDRPAWMDIDFASMPEVQLLQDYIAIDTTSGKEAAGAEWLAARLRERGVEPHIERLATGQANLWAIIEGRRSEALVLHHHIDVYPVVEDNWDTPPFEGRILGPLLAGRGAFDMKSYGVAQLLAFLDVAASGEQPEYSLILLATADEETGSRLGTRWFVRQHPELVERFWTVLSEGGANESFEEGIVRYWGIEVGHMQLINIVACAPTQRRLEELALDLLRRPQEEITVLPVVAETLRALTPHRRSPGHVLAMEDPSKLPRDRWRVDRLPQFLRYLLFDRLEVLGFGEGESGYVMGLIAWRLPGQAPIATNDPTLGGLLPEELAAGVHLSVQIDPGPPSSPIDHPVFATLSRRLAARGSDSGPYMLPATYTDSREFRSRGIPSYGYSPFAFVAAGLGGKDRDNERILLTAYVDGVAEYRRAVTEIVGLPDPS